MRKNRPDKADTRSLRIIASIQDLCISIRKPVLACPLSRWYYYGTERPNHMTMQRILFACFSYRRDSNRWSCETRYDQNSYPGAYRAEGGTPAHSNRYGEGFMVMLQLQEELVGLISLAHARIRVIQNETMYGKGLSIPRKPGRD